MDIAITDYNNYLSEAYNISRLINNSRVDFLQLLLESDNFILYAVADPIIIKTIQNMGFRIKGEVIFEEGSEVRVDEMIIEDIIY